ncbi:CEN-like protein 1 [Parachaetomium inaequale]|uniref:CEN-like protein 1 n=1 Tax=Parachaetomium inaequale TaxID=2588326 RepID=A0AAN6PKY8_9PEZI|nr:CEN-like protein 1 [Parachaetomium inaequale]
MVSKCLAALVAAATVLARTPAGFTPSSETDLVVEYNGFAPLNGVVVSRSVTTSQPRIGTRARLNGTSYAVMMIDLDIPTNNPPETNTLLHWMQTGLTPATAPTTLNTTAGTISAFLLEPRSSSSNSTTGAAAAAAAVAEAIRPYSGPNPPARVPLSHRYTQILVDTSGLTAQGVEALRGAAATIRGFDAGTALAAAGLEGRVVAGNSYNVTNAGPALAPNATTGGGAGGGGGGGSASGTGVIGGGASQTAVLPGAGVGLRPGSVVLGGLVAVGMVAVGL